MEALGKDRENKEKTDVRGWIIVDQKDEEWLKSLPIVLGEKHDVSVVKEKQEIMFEDCVVSEEMYRTLLEEKQKGRIKFELRNRENEEAHKKHRQRDNK